MSVPVTSTAAGLQVGSPALLFQPNINVDDGFRNRMIITADGQRFLALKPLIDRRSSPVTVVVNWTGLLTR